MSWGAACKSSLINVSELQSVWSFFEARSALLPKQLMKAKKPHRYFLSCTAASSVLVFTVFTFVHESISVKRLAAPQVLHLKGRPAGHTGVALTLKESLELRQFSFFVCMNSELHLLFTSFTQTGKHRKIITPVFYSEKSIRWVFSGLIYNDGLHFSLCGWRLSWSQGGFDLILCDLIYSDFFISV